MKRTTWILLLMVVVSLMSCSDTGRRDAQKMIDKVSHSGHLVGYQSVYVIDFENETYYVDRNPDQDLLTYPIYRNDDGTYCIEYGDEDYTLYELGEPINIFGTGITLLRYRFCDYSHYIIEIPTSY